MPAEQLSAMGQGILPTMPGPFSLTGFPRAAHLNAVRGAEWREHPAQVNLIILQIILHSHLCAFNLVRPGTSRALAYSVVRGYRRGIRLA